MGNTVNGAPQNTFFAMLVQGSALAAGVPTGAELQYGGVQRSPTSKKTAPPAWHRNVRFWHKADIPTRSTNVRFWG
jgi:hypothetical protein